jgi:hypothetical protein
MEVVAEADSTAVAAAAPTVVVAITNSRNL